MFSAVHHVTLHACRSCSVVEAVVACDYFVSFVSWTNDFWKKNCCCFCLVLFYFEKKNRQRGKNQWATVISLFVHLNQRDYKKHFNNNENIYIFTMKIVVVVFSRPINHFVFLVVLMSRENKDFAKQHVRRLLSTLRWSGLCWLVWNYWPNNNISALLRLLAAVQALLFRTSGTPSWNVIYSHQNRATYFFYETGDQCSF